MNKVKKEKENDDNINEKPDCVYIVLSEYLHCQKMKQMKFSERNERN